MPRTESRQDRGPDRRPRWRKAALWAGCAALAAGGLTVGSAVAASAPATSTSSGDVADAAAAAPAAASTGCAVNSALQRAFEDK